jgi:Asp-tRNA(Asn)/Glu-tRNA(Gln) amidotransferase A subunit family amidase
VTDVDALATAARVRRGDRSARNTVEETLRAIAERDGVLNCFTTVLRDYALRAADAIDALTAAGKDPGPLAGVPLAVKNLFDVAGVTTLAGSRINRERPPAPRDAAAVRALRRAGAVVIGCCNMDEYAYGFSTENTHYGPTRNPHDPACMAGGSSRGSAAAVAAGFVPMLERRDACRR